VHPPQVAGRNTVATSAARSARAIAKAWEDLAPDGLALGVFDLNRSTHLPLETLVQSFQIASCLPGVDIERPIERFTIRNRKRVRTDERLILTD
jgi:hypothetical protein